MIDIIRYQRENIQISMVSPRFFLQIFFFVFFRQKKMETHKSREKLNANQTRRRIIEVSLVNVYYTLVTTFEINRFPKVKYGSSKRRNDGMFELNFTTSFLRRGFILRSTLGIFLPSS